MVLYIIYKDFKPIYNFTRFIIFYSYILQIFIDAMLTSIKAVPLKKYECTDNVTPTVIVYELLDRLQL